MKRLLMASVLAGLLAVTAMAGDISTSGSPSPSQIPSDGVTGQIPNVGAVDPVSDAVLSGVLAALSLLCK
jgi:hypothetical protein